MTTYANQPEQDIEKLARKRAGAKFGWYVHALVYVLVNAGLMIGALASGRMWAFGPLLGWGVGLAIHGMVVFARISGQSLRERMIEKERRAILAERG